MADAKRAAAGLRRFPRVWQPPNTIGFFHHRKDWAPVWEGEDPRRNLVPYKRGWRYKFPMTFPGRQDTVEAPLTFGYSASVLTVEGGDGCPNNRMTVSRMVGLKTYADQLVQQHFGNPKALEMFGHRVMDEPCLGHAEVHDLSEIPIDRRGKHHIHIRLPSRHAVYKGHKLRDVWIRKFARALNEPQQPRNGYDCKIDAEAFVNAVEEIDERTPLTGRTGKVWDLVVEGERRMARMDQRYFVDQIKPDTPFLGLEVLAERFGGSVHKKMVKDHYDRAFGPVVREKKVRRAGPKVVKQESSAKRRRREVAEERR